MKNTDKAQPKQGQGQKKPKVQSGNKKLSSGKRQQPETALQTSEEKFRQLFETAEARYHLLYENMPMMNFTVGKNGKVLAVNHFGAEQLGYSVQELVGQPVVNVFCNEDKPIVRRQLKECFQNPKRIFEWDLRKVHKGGQLLWVHETARVMQEKDRPVLLIACQNITERKKIEDELRLSEEKFSKVFHTSPDSVNINRLADGRFIEINKGFTQLTGYTAEDIDGKTSLEINIWVNPDDPARLVKELRKHSGMANLEAPFRLKDGTVITGLMSAAAIVVNGEECILSITRDISERKWAEETLRASEMRYRGLFENSPISLWEEDFSAVKRHIEKLRRQGVTDFRDFFENNMDVVIECVKKIKVIDVNNTALALVRAANKPQLIRNLKQIIRVGTGEDFIDELVSIAEGKTEFEWEGINHTLDNDEALTVSLRWSAAPGYEDTLEQVMVSMIDVTKRKRAEKALALQTEELRQRNEELTRLNEQAERRMQRLVSMRTIDMAISGSFDVSIILGIVLDQITGQLGSHAADVLLFSQGAKTFKFSCGRGFRIQGLEHSLYKFGSDIAWRIIKERRKVEIFDLKTQTIALDRSPDLSGEDFVSYIGVPLVTKGQVRGVLEVFHREQLKPDREWYNYLEMLAGQAAIAIDNAELFEHMQSSNTELVMAFDSTLVSWANALELRALESEGHTRRVDNLATHLAQVLGLNDNDLINIHRGALLHDVGKIGVPDSIVLKPGPLTEEEWELMRKHPQVAFDMLSPIAYLRPALDIPYYHHEKWDGTGYPRGLKGENIPLAARIFAVGDVWDALTSDRPYRKAWSEMEALEYIREQAGQHFDPVVVKTFLDLPANKRNGT